jgi:signal recognition particle receptor subunit beta
MYLFGTPGQDRFGFMWDDICLGALGAVVLVDPRRITDSFPGIDYFEANAIPFVIGVNVFAGAARYPTNEIREALGVAGDTPIVDCDARNKDSVKMVLLTLLESLVAKAQARAHMR